jgi:AmmeMemoRadiSam system protein A
MAIAESDRSALIALAKSAIASQVTGQPCPPTPALAGLLAQRLGCFVTITNHGDLRGCIGTFQPREPLGELVANMGRSAAADPRFVYNPITPSELPQLHVEVSVLSELEETKNPLELAVGRHGIYIMRAGRSGCFLPEVATDMGWDARQFLDECCSGKAGLPPGAWQLAGTRVFLFTSEKFDH